LLARGLAVALWHGELVTACPTSSAPRPKTSPATAAPTMKTSARAPDVSRLQSTAASGEIVAGRRRKEIPTWGTRRGGRDPSELLFTAWWSRLWPCVALSARHASSSSSLAAVWWSRQCPVGFIPATRLLITAHARWRRGGRFDGGLALPSLRCASPYSSEAS
jgi:hypothetical protein